jgi:hypothetical protein
MFKHNFGSVNDFKWKGCQLQSCRSYHDLQLLFWSFLHPSSFEQFKNI